MSWLSYHFYPLETPDVFLVRGIKPFLEHHIWNKKGARAFFIRYKDETGPHIRLRLHPASEEEAGTLNEVVKGWFTDRGTCKEVPYVGEAERFGGPEPLMWAEEYFHISTRVALERLAQPTYTYGDALLDTMRMQVSALHAIGLNREQTKSYCGRLGDAMVPAFFQHVKPSAKKSVQALVKADCMEGMASQREALQGEMDALWEALTADQFDNKQPEWLRWFRGNRMIIQGMGNNGERAFPSLLHLHCNRMGISNQDEVYVCYIIADTL
jgi:thiopeptide-type bacteriocin biosynthesis protein